ncbi:DUF4224 domain-containing protein [Silvimonas sp.]|uniref:DUF4224 domain-containing protein n=1 Tax=Silvimonas sp. TaxID=2650811 RepID=UPI002844F3EA|nr:DUF4224 domain-containing protein [Silvimonas sp.]MDR3427967.1 DUF4224 domain-containing protein [Silvimonas sp.]
MGAIFDMQLASETLATDELTQITGCSRKGDQIAWLNLNGWTYFKNKAGEPIVGRMFARLKLSGISPTSLTTGGWAPDFSSVK